MKHALVGILTVIGRILLAAVFLMSAVGHKIPKFSAVAEGMAAEGIPFPQMLLAGAIVFLVFGSVSLILGLRGRLGAVLLMVFLLAATYFYHDFWTLEGDAVKQQMAHFMKNVSLMGALLLIVVNGTGPFSIDGKPIPKNKSAELPV